VKYVLVLLLYGFTCLIIAQTIPYATKCLLINSYDEIVIQTQFSDSLETNCTWFDELSSQ